MRKKYFGKVVRLLLLFMVIITTYGYFHLQDTSKKTSLDALKEELVQVNNSNSSQEGTITDDEEGEIGLLQQKYNNPDIQGIISIDNSDFRQPLVQTVDNEYYLTHNYKREEYALGAIYADYRVNLEAGRKILIFGHSSTKTDTPFNYLENYYDQNFYENHKYITLETQNNTYRYEIFSVYVETSDFTYMNVNFDTQEDWYLHILKLQKKSLYSIDITLEKEDDILIMQTCSNHSKYKNNSKKYLLIVSRRVK